LGWFQLFRPGARPVRSPSFRGHPPSVPQAYAAPGEFIDALLCLPGVYASRAVHITYYVICQSGICAHVNDLPGRRNGLMFGNLTCTAFNWFG
jgi:hypothetical protein